MIRCGWCGHPTAPDHCGHCQRDPAVPWVQRGVIPPTVEEHDAGRPALDEDAIRSRYGAARAALIAEGRAPTLEGIAERLDRSPRTVRQWRQRFSLE